MRGDGGKWNKYVLSESLRIYSEGKGTVPKPFHSACLSRVTSSVSDSSVESMRGVCV